MDGVRGERRALGHRVAADHDPPDPLAGGVGRATGRGADRDEREAERDEARRERTPAAGPGWRTRSLHAQGPVGAPADGWGAVVLGPVAPVTPVAPVVPVAPPVAPTAGTGCVVVAAGEVGPVAWDVAPVGPSAGAGVVGVVFAWLGDPLKYVVESPLPVIDLPAITSSAVNRPTTITQASTPVRARVASGGRRCSAR